MRVRDVMKIALRTIAATVVGSFLVAASPALAETLNYTVLRDGKTIGTHAVQIDQNGAQTQVSVETDIAVKVLFVTAYKFKHSSKETWAGGTLQSISSKTDDDGTPKELTARAEDGRITVDSIVKGQERRQFADATALPASLWNPATVSQSALLNTLDGQIMKVSIEDMGTETVDAGGVPLAAHHYAISGELTRDLWFDDAGRLVRMRFPDKTNSEIVYALN